MTSSRQVGALLCILMGAPTASWAADSPAGAAGAVQAETVVVRVSLNTEDKGDVFVARTPDDDFLVRVQDLKAMGFREPAGTVRLVEGEPHLSLRSMAGVSFVFQEKGLALNITADPKLLPEQAIALRGERRLRGAVPRDSSVFLNYALNYHGGDTAAGSRLGLAGETGWRFGDFLLLSDASTTQTAGGGSKLVRLLSSVTYDDRETLRRVVVGDFFTPSRDFSNGANLGGVSLSKLYSLDPYLIKFPTQSITGNVALPSDLEVYLDGQRIRSEKLNPGEFQLRDLLAYSGARSVQVVLRDAFGRVQQFNYSFYFSDQPLQKGLQEYSYNLGALRRNFGSQSNRYGPAAFSAFHRYGASDWLTLGMRAEGTGRLLNAGPSATLVLGSAGVVNLAVATSRFEGRHGAAASVGYSYQARNWSLGASLRRDWRDFAMLGDPPTISYRKYEGNASVSYNLPGFGAVSLSHSVFAASGAQSTSTDPSVQLLDGLALQDRRVTALTYSVPLVPGKVSLSASLSHIKDKDSRNEGFVGLLFFPDKDHSAAANFRGNSNSGGSGSGSTQSFQFTRNQPIGEGLGYVLAADRASGIEGATSQLKSTAQYNAVGAILRGEYSQARAPGQLISDYRFSAAGGLAYVGGSFAVGRPVTESFAVVKVGQLAGVTVLVNGQNMGKTNAQGQLFVPTLAPYYDSDVSLAGETLPIEYSLPSISKKVSPSLRSGAVIDFAVTKVQAFTGTLKHSLEGTPKPVEFLEVGLTAEGKPLTFQTGRGGEFYLENLKPGTYAATVLIEGKPCRFDLVIPRSEETFVQLDELVCRPGP